jgi:hypothetical protein
MCQNQILKSQGHQSKANRKPSVCQISPVGRQPDGVCRWWRRAFTIRLSAQTSRQCKLHSLAAWPEHQQSGDRAIRRSKMKIETIRPRSSQLAVHGGFLAHPGSTGHTRSHCPMSHGCRILHLYYIRGYRGFDDKGLEIADSPWCHTDFAHDWENGLPGTILRLSDPLCVWGDTRKLVTVPRQTSWWGMPAGF